MRWLTFIVFFSSLISISQSAYMRIDTNRMRIGEQTVLRIYFEYTNPKEDALIGWPQYDNFLTDDIEIIDRTVDYETLIDSSTQTYLREQLLTISVFEPGNYIIPAQEIELNESSYLTNELNLLVETVAVDTSKGLVDIKPPYQVEYTFGEMVSDWFKSYWYYIAGAAALAALFLLFRFLKNRREDEPEPEAPKIPAHITALNALQNLHDQESWKSENRKDYYSSLTNIVRLYLEERFEIYALEKTTKEIIFDLKKSDISDADKLFLKNILTKADMVKFAKFKPVEEDGLHLLNQSIEFVNRTKKIETDTNQNNNE